MSDKEMISKAFASLKAPEDTLERIHEKMDNKKGFFRNRRFVMVLTVLLIFALSGACVYAAKAFRMSKGFLDDGSGEAGGVQEFRISCPFDEENPITAAHHQGIDFIAEEGTPVYAAAPGKVATAEFDNDRGYHVIILHEGGYSSLYAHMKELKVTAGDMVNEGDVIGSVGKTGKATGAHLHLELLQGDTPVNPADFWE